MPDVAIVSQILSKMKVSYDLTNVMYRFVAISSLTVINNLAYVVQSVGFHIATPSKRCSSQNKNLKVYYKIKYFLI